MWIFKYTWIELVQTGLHRLGVLSESLINCLEALIKLYERVVDAATENARTVGPTDTAELPAVVETLLVKPAELEIIIVLLNYVLSRILGVLPHKLLALVHVFFTILVFDLVIQVVFKLSHHVHELRSGLLAGLLHLLKLDLHLLKLELHIRDLRVVLRTQLLLLRQHKLLLLLKGELLLLL